jgi:triosephosphate isomerase
MMANSQMRRPLVAGNWKMNLGPAEAGALAESLLAALPPAHLSAVEVVLCPPSISLERVAQTVRGRCGVGAQNIHWQASGAFTGEIAASMLSGVCQYVILGHSERRAYFGETDEGVQRKTATALAAGLTPIICVGESETQRTMGLTMEWVALQVRAALYGRSAEEIGRSVIAYEPIWAIGTGLAASGPLAQEVIAHIRMVLQDLAGPSAGQVRIVYGGSVTGANAAEFFGQPDVDGALVGGASLKVAEFTAIVAAAAAALAILSTKASSLHRRSRVGPASQSPIPVRRERRCGSLVGFPVAASRRSLRTPSPCSVELLIQCCTWARSAATRCACLKS